MAANIAGKASRPRHNHSHCVLLAPVNIGLSLRAECTFSNGGLTGVMSLRKRALIPRPLRHVVPVRLIQILILALFCLAGATAQAAHTQATLVLGVETARPGETVLAGVRLQMDRG